MKNSKTNNFGIISAIGILFMLFGFGYMTFKLKEIDDKVKNKQAEFQKVNEEYKNITKEFKKAEQQLELKKDLIQELDSLIKKSNDSILIRTSKDEILTNNHLAKTIQSEASNPTIYIQTDTKEIQHKLEKIDLVGVLNTKGYKTYGYDFVNGRADNSIRYFHKEDEKIASDIQSFIAKEYGIDLKLVLITRYKGKAPKKQIELWVKG